MVLEIFVFAEIENTQIKKNNELILLNALPKGLKKKLSETLILLKATQIVVNTDQLEKSILVFLGQNKLLLDMDKKIQEQTKSVLKLLVWYFSPHFRSWNPGLIGGDVHCAVCGWLQSPGYGSEYCENPNCPSHKMWQEIIGPSYKLPKFKTPKITIDRNDSGITPEQVEQMRKEIQEMVAKKKQQAKATI